MAGDGDTSGDLKFHQESYERFIGWVKVGALATAVIVALVIFLLTR